MQNIGQWLFMGSQPTGTCATGEGRWRGVRCVSAHSQPRLAGFQIIFTSQDSDELELWIGPELFEHRAHARKCAKRFEAHTKMITQKYR